MSPKRAARSRGGVQFPTGGVGCGLGQTLSPRALGGFDKPPGTADPV